MFARVGALAGGQPVRPTARRGQLRCWAGRHAVGDTALLRAGGGRRREPARRLDGDSTGWTTSAPLTGTGQVPASGTGPGGTAWVLLAVAAPPPSPDRAAPWRLLTAPPPGTAALAASRAAP